MNIKQQIIDRINNSFATQPFIANDFYDIASYETIRSTLNRLVKDKKINRIIKGVYYKPVYIDLINEYEAPSVDGVARALARKYNWTIVPSGNTALNLLGLSTQVPAKWVYVSNGRYASFSFENVTIEFKHTTNKNISNMTTLTAMIIQAIKTIGKDNVSNNQIDYLKQKLNDQEKMELFEGSKTTSAWIFQIIRKICGEEVCLILKD